VADGIKEAYPRALRTRVYHIRVGMQPALLGSRAHCRNHTFHPGAAERSSTLSCFVDLPTIPQHYYAVAVSSAIHFSSCAVHLIYWWKQKLCGAVTNALTFCYFTLLFSSLI
jgi:hypothetical protein